MHSIPHKPPHSKRKWFSSSRGAPSKKMNGVNDLQIRWKIYHLILKIKGGVGVLFLGRIIPNLGREMAPPMFSYTKGWGVYICLNF